MKLDEIVGLQHHVVELDEAQWLLALETQLHRILGEHAVHAEMASVIAKEPDIAELIEPIGVVDHDGVVGTVAEAHESPEDRLDTGDIGRDLGLGEQLALFVLA